MQTLSPTPRIYYTAASPVTAVITVSGEGLTTLEAGSEMLLEDARLMGDCVNTVNLTAGQTVTAYTGGTATITVTVADVDVTATPAANNAFTLGLQAIRNRMTAAGLWFVTTSEKALINNQPVYRRITANATTTGTALVNIAPGGANPTSLSALLDANAIYEIEAVLSVSTSAVTSGTAYGINFSAAGAAVLAFANGSGSGNTPRIDPITAFDTPTGNYLTASAQTGMVHIKGQVQTGANAGTLAIRHRKTNSGTSTVFAGSYLKVFKVA